jgi:hypothetical protein
MSKRVLIQFFILFITVFCFAGLVFSQPQLKSIGPMNGPVAAVQKTEPPTPGKLSKTVKLTNGQKKLLSGPGEFAIYGPREPISREQISSMRELRLKRASSGRIVNPVLSDEDTISSENLYTITGKRQKMVNARDLWYPGEDFYSTYITQSEVSSAVYGNHIVAGWNDFETLLAYDSIANWAVSHDGGKTFTDSLSGLPTFAAPGITATFGDPAVGVSSNGTFYYATLCNYNDLTNDYSAVCVYKSTDNGDAFTFLDGRYALDTNDFVDKDFLTVGNDGRVYVTFTYFDDASPLYSIVVWNVSDGTLPNFIASNDNGLQGSIPAADRDGNLYVAYESWDALGNRSIKLKKSIDHGANFGTEVNVASVIPAADSVIGGDASTFCGRDAIKGNIRSNDFPSLAVDTRASGNGAGNLYIAFNARAPITGFLNIYLTRFTDGGATWSTPIIANPRPAGDESDKFFPWITVNGKGKVGLVYYERKKTPGISGVAPNNWWILTTVRRFKHDLTLIDSLNVSPTFPVVTNNDYTAACYMAEYNSISANRQSADDNFYVFWGDNRFGDPDIQFSKVVPVVY